MLLEESYQKTQTLFENNNIPALVEFLNNGNTMAAQALGKLKSNVALVSLMEALHNEHSQRPRYKIAVADALKNIGNPYAINHLRASLKDEYITEIRVAIYNALDELEKN